MGFGDKSKKEKQAETAASSKAAKDASSEAASWKDTDKGLNAKAARKDAAADKDADKQARKAELKELEAAEEEALGASVKKPAPKKMTQAQIAQKNALLAAAAKQAQKKKEKEESSQPKLEPNMNHVNRDKALEAAAEGYELVDASSVDAALAGLAGEKKLEKLSYAQYEARVLPVIKEDNPGLKASQQKELAWKQWKKAPENPSNQQ